MNEAAFHVDCAPGHAGEATPWRLHFGRRSVRVTEVLDRWHGGDHRYVKVAGDDGALYIVRWDATRAVWELALFDSRTDDT